MTSLKRAAQNPGRKSIYRINISDKKAHLLTTQYAVNAETWEWYEHDGL